MARQVITKLLDDLDGSEADETVSFALDGIGYEIDLNGRNAKKIRDFLYTYIEAGTRLGRVGSGIGGGKSRPTADHHATAATNRELNHAIREWALASGYELSERGRIPTHIQDAYATKTPNPARIRQEPLPDPEPESLKPERANGRAPAKKAAAKKVAVPAFSGGARSRS